MLTEKQFEVMSMKSRGMTNKQIAGQLSINESTVQEHVQAVVKKLGATNPTHCVTLFAQQRLADRLRASGLEETLRAFIKMQTGRESLSEITLDDGLADIVEYIETVLSEVSEND
ncbi:MAG: helix-turn-helix transcriptional regulator [Rhizobiaceae bacterium]|nr:helix-turn-helix transcriptional regulator [Rhizobiaceae bacterium]